MLGIQSPAGFALIAGSLFLLIAEAVLIGPGPYGRGTIIQLNATDTIALLAGTVTAMGLAAIYFQVLEAGRSARAHAIDAQRQSALHLDALHATFNAMYDERTVAYSYLKMLCNNPRMMEAYARYWITDVGFNPPMPPANDIDQSAIGPPVESDVPYCDRDAERTFREQDRAVSTMVSFFVRLSVHLRVTLNGRNILEPADDLMKEAAAPFYWNSYWSLLFIPFMEACELVYRTSDAKFEYPHFLVPLRRLEKLLGCRSRNAASIPQ